MNQDMNEIAALLATQSIQDPGASRPDWDIWTEQVNEAERAFYRESAAGIMSALVRMGWQKANA